MITLSGNTIYLRALEPEDLDFLYKLENDETVWEVSETLAPYSKYILKEYLANSHKDIFEVKQLRLAISNYAETLLGFIDLYDFNPKNKRAGVGIIILEEGNRNKGIGREALSLLIAYAFKHLDLHQLFANISEQNKPSIQLFSNLGFERVGIKKDWNYTSGKFQNEILYQKINK
ncbi:MULTISPECIES: GNAT family N-acetyltransferase [Galbibacter]|uniref:GNAT family N-acetyltransferase n=1 Tax=Galbibacter pacificus TaxID=2996052 RepID=A0ABT6FPF3_9FLAO|nr:GNAT family N-acetyltransferase [Galbibacter pacificus]MDG3582375.1 GNAT family N-acetyltransferase [Galbibacter pacificus]MDG3585149.1 GNAT family N-acetyltransferase [Galbibacter pacificus]